MPQDTVPHDTVDNTSELNSPPGPEPVIDQTPYSQDTVEDIHDVDEPPDNEIQPTHLDAATSTVSVESLDAATQLTEPPSIIPINVDTSIGVYDDHDDNGRSVYERRFETERSADLSARGSATPSGPAAEHNDPNPQDFIILGHEPPPVTGKRGWSETHFRRDLLVAWFVADSNNRRLHQTEVPSPPENWHEAIEHPFWDSWLSRF